jgi:hypothetical protein
MYDFVLVLLLESRVRVYEVKQWSCRFVRIVRIVNGKSKLELLVNCDDKPQYVSIYQKTEE